MNFTQLWLPSPDKGWYCFSSGQGGGALELVQQTQGLSCYAAARWLLDNGLSSAADPGEAAALPAAALPTEKRPNRPIRQDLLPLLTPEHPELERRGLSPETCAYLSGDVRKSSLDDTRKGPPNDVAGVKDERHGDNFSFL